MNYQLHLVCSAWPSMPDADLKALAEDIKVNGLREPIALDPKGLLLDGRNRMLACEMVGVQPLTVVHDGDPVMFSLSKNKHRRHMNKSQLAMVAAKLANLQNGSNQYRRKQKVGLRDSQSHSVDEIAKELGTGQTAIREACVVLEKGLPHIQQMVDDGDINSQYAAMAVRKADHATQATWKTAKDVTREARKALDNQPAKRRKRGEQPNPTRRKFAKPHDPYAGKHLGQIDPGPITQRGEQRVYLWAPYIQDLMDDHLTISTDVIGPLITFRPGADEKWKATPEVIGPALKRLLAHRPKPKGTGYNGEDIDFATKLRKELKLITDGRIRRAIDWLTGVEAAIAEALS